MRVIVGCEFSQIVTKAFRKCGHDAYSCDLLATEGNPEWHFQEDIFQLLERKDFDLGIFHPPCTYLCSSGLHWNTKRPGRAKLTEEALIFVEKLLSAEIPKICLENPIGRINTAIRKPNQYIQPYAFGHDASKKTGLWLKGLPKLQPTKSIVRRLICCGEEVEESLGKYGCPYCCGKHTAKRRWANQTNSGQNKLPPSKDRWKLRSTTYQGWADAMADQWG